MVYDNKNFPSLPNSWHKILVSEACNNISVHTKIQQKLYKSTGLLPIIDQGAGFIGGYTDDLEKSITHQLPVVVFGDHTRMIKYIDFLFAAGADGIKVIKPKEIFFPRLFYRFLQVIRLPEKGYARHYQYLRTSFIALPPLNEQKRIADKLDSMLARVDACRERLDRIPAILKRFRQAVLAAATSGKLTEEWRNFNKIFTHNLSWKLAEQRAQLWIGRGKYRPAIAAEDIECNEFTNLPDSWIRGTLDQITWSVKDGPHYSPEYRKSGVPFISGGSIKPGKIDLSIAKYIDPILHHELSQRCKPEYHDILYTKGGTTGIAAVNTLKVDFNVWVHVAVLKLISKELMNPFFIQHALNSPYCYSQSQRYTHGVGNQDLGLTRMIKIVIPIPPIEEQTEIVRRVEELFAYADRIEARYHAARAQTDKLTPAILAKAFRGELVPQDPNDEPASVLFDRIRASRAEHAVTPKSKRSRTIASRKTPDIE